MEVNNLLLQYEKQNGVCYFCEEDLNNLAKKKQVVELDGFLVCSECLKIKGEDLNSDFAEKIKHWKNKKCKKNEVKEYATYLKLSKKFK